MTDRNARRLGPFTLFLGLLLALAALGLWYSTEPALHADAEEAPSQAGDVVAKVGDIEIRQADLESANQAGFLELRRNRQQLLESTLESVINQKLLELEAAATGVAVEELTATAVAANVAEPTDAEVDAFYEERKDQINQPKESIAPRIREFLLQQRRQAAFDDYVKSLRAKYPVESHLEPLRLEVDTAGFPAQGPATAPVTIVEFSDFECPYCSRVVPTLERVREAYGDKVRLVFRQFPLLAIHPNAQKAAEASLCAHDQDAFWKMHDTMFQEQKALGVEQLKQKAARLGLEAETFNECLDSGKYAQQVMADLEAGSSVGVTGTPAMFINGRFLSGAQPFEEISRVIDDELARLQ